MEIRDQLQRYIDRRVSLDLFGRCTIWGKLVAVEHDHLLLADTVVHRDAETLSRFDEFDLAIDGEGDSMRFSESIIYINSISQVTYVDNRDFQRELRELPRKTSLVVQSAVDEAEHSSSNPPADSDENTADSDENTATSQPSSFDRDFKRIEVQLGLKLIALADNRRGGALLDRLGRIRKNIGEQTGYVIPKVRVIDNLSLPDEGYAIVLNGNRMATGQVEVDSKLALNVPETPNVPEPHGALQGRPALDPVFGLASMWIEADQVDRCEESGLSVVDATTVILTHIDYVVQRHLHEVINVTDVLEHIESLALQNALDVLFRDPFPISLLHRLLRQLLEERVSIRNLSQIVESLAFHMNQGVQLPKLFERVRIDIGRTICTPLLDAERRLNAVCIHGKAAKMLAKTNALDFVRDLGDTKMKSLNSSLKRLGEAKVVVLQDASLRRHVYDLLSRHVDDVHVLAVAEIPHDIKINCTKPQRATAGVS